jgi:hypothetical protein
LQEHTLTASLLSVSESILSFCVTVLGSLKKLPLTTVVVAAAVAAVRRAAIFMVDDDEYNESGNNYCSVIHNDSFRGQRPGSLVDGSRGNSQTLSLLALYK